MNCTAPSTNDAEMFSSKPMEKISACDVFLAAAYRFHESDEAKHVEVEVKTAPYPRANARTSDGLAVFRVDLSQNTRECIVAGQVCVERRAGRGSSPMNDVIGLSVKSFNRTRILDNQESSLFFTLLTLSESSNSTSSMYRAKIPLYVREIYEAFRSVSTVDGSSEIILDSANIWVKSGSSAMVHEDVPYAGNVV